MPYISGSNKIIKRYKGTQLIYQAEDSSEDTTSESIATENTLSFKYVISDIVTSSNISINGTSHILTAAHGESLGDGYYKFTIGGTDTEEITSIRFLSGNVYEIYALPNGLTDMSQMFNSCSALGYFNLYGLNTSNVTNMSFLFSNLSLNETIIDVRGWDISNVTSYDYMFYNSTKIQKLILGNVSQTTFDWWYARLTDAGIQGNVTIEYTIV